jgi:hypothetical protein
MPFRCCEKAAITVYFSPRKGLEGCRQPQVALAATARSGVAGAQRSPAKPGFRREALEMCPNFLEKSL